MNPQFSKQMLCDIEKYISPVLKEYFFKEQERLPYMDMSDCIYMILKDRYNGQLSTDAVSSTYSKTIRSFRARKRRWYNNANKYATIYSSDYPGYPYYEIYVYHRTLKNEDWRKLYGEKTLKECIAEFDEKAINWLKDDNQYLIEFPFLNTCSLTMIESAFVLDMMINVYRIINEIYKGTMSSYFRNWPTALMEAPIFSSEPLFVKANRLSGKLIEEYMVTDDGVLLSTEIKNTNNKINQIRILDNTDQDILNLCFSNLTDAFYTDHTVTIRLMDVIRILFKNVKRPSCKHYGVAEKRCATLSLNNYSVFIPGSTTKPGEKIIFNLIDNVSFPDTEERLAVLKLGDVLSEAITNRKIVTITTSNYESLKNTDARNIYPALQRQRIRLSSPFFGHIEDIRDSDMLLNTDDRFFQKSIRFNTRTKKIIYERINALLQDFKDNNIVIKDFYSDGGIFRITLFPLTKAEEDDLTFSSKNGTLMLDFSETELGIIQK